MYEPPEHRYRVPFDGSFELSQWPTDKPDDCPDKGERKARLKDATDEIYELQRALYAEDQWALLLVFQAMDAAGKDSTIRHVMTGVNPAGFQVSSFKQPSAEELDHDFLWRCVERLPQRGRIGIFNRSYYEEVLVVRVHPEYLEGQRLPPSLVGEDIWQQRYRSIRDHERHLAANGTAVVKFFLNVSWDEQRERFLRRIRRPDKNWKFSSGDVRERGFWNDYMAAYEDALNATSRPWAPWYAIPADSKSYMRMVVAEIVVATLKGIDPRRPELPPDEQAELDEEKERLLSEIER